MLDRMHFSAFDQLGEGGQYSITTICSGTPCPCNSGVGGGSADRRTETTGWEKLLFNNPVVALHLGRISI